MSSFEAEQWDTSYETPMEAPPKLSDHSCRRSRLARTATYLTIQERTSITSRPPSGNHRRPRPLIVVLRSRLQISMAPAIKFATLGSRFFAVAAILSAVGG